jgi:hypothetical protein
MSATSISSLKRWGNRTCNIVENGVATLWKNYLQLSGKSSCKKQKENTNTMV